MKLESVNDRTFSGSLRNDKKYSEYSYSMGASSNKIVNSSSPFRKVRSSFSKGKVENNTTFKFKS